MMNGNWVSYQNGNYTVSIDLETGTKIRENDLDFFDAAFPESMDIKITNRCNMNCPMCHEDSKCDGLLTLTIRLGMLSLALPLS